MIEVLEIDPQRGAFNGAVDATRRLEVLAADLFHGIIGA
jgi:hypothetical protein